MTFSEFTKAFNMQLNAFHIINKSLVTMIRPELKELFIPEPFARCIGERFGTPAVKWGFTDKKIIVSLPSDEIEIIQNDQNSFSFFGKRETCTIRLINESYTIS